MRITSILLGLSISLTAAYACAEQMVSLPPNQITQVEKTEPLTEAEIQSGLQAMQSKLNLRIEKWGQTLQQDDFEWSMRGRILKQPKRQEVCQIFQGVIDETYALALKNKHRLAEADQLLLKDRSAFIQRLGYEDNIVDTRMKFNCRLR